MHLSLTVLFHVYAGVDIRGSWWLAFQRIHHILLYHHHRLIEQRCCTSCKMIWNTKWYHHCWFKFKIVVLIYMGRFTYTTCLFLPTSISWRFRTNCSSSCWRRQWFVFMYSIRRGSIGICIDSRCINGSTNWCRNDGTIVWYWFAIFLLLCLLLRWPRKGISKR